MKKLLFLFLLINYSLSAQITDLSKLQWNFRGPNKTLLEGRHIIDIDADPNDPADNTVWALTRGGALFVNREIRNANSQWTQINTPDLFKKIFFEPNPIKKLYAISDHNLYISQDDGKTWKNLFYYAARVKDLLISKSGKKVVITETDTYIILSDTETTFYNIAPTHVWIDYDDILYYVLEEKAYWLDGSKKNQKPNLTSMTEMQLKGFPFPYLEHFGAYIITDNSQYFPNSLYHAFRQSSQRIITDKSTYSVDGGKNYKKFVMPENTNEVVFAGEYLVFATNKGIFVKKNTLDTQNEVRNNGLESEYRMTAFTALQGDDVITAMTDKRVFSLSNENTAPIPIQDYFDGEFRWITNELIDNRGRELYKIEANGDRETSKISYIAGLQYILLEADILYELNYRPYDPFFNNTIYTRKPFIDYPSAIALDYSYNTTNSSIYTIYSDGALKILNLKTRAIQTVQVPVNANLKFIRDEGNDPQRLIIGRTDGVILTTTNLGNTWQTLTETPIKGSKINFVEYNKAAKTLFVATDKAVWAVENIFTTTPKWTNLTQSLGEQAFNHVAFKDLPKETMNLVITSAKKGIYTADWFISNLQLVTKLPNLESLFSGTNSLQNSLIQPKICKNSKLNVPFSTNIPQDGTYEFTINLIDSDNKKVSVEAKPFTNYFEVTMNIAALPIPKKYKFGVSARNKTTNNVIEGAYSPEFDYTEYSEILVSGSYHYLYCSKDSVTIIPQEVEYIDLKSATYTWELNGNLLPTETKSTLKTNREGNYERTTKTNGCPIVHFFKVEQKSYNPTIVRYDAIQKYKLEANNAFIYPNQYENIIKNELITLNPYASILEKSPPTIEIYKDGELIDQSNYTKSYWSLNSFGSDVRTVFFPNDDGTYQFKLKDRNCPIEPFKVGRKVQSQGFDFINDLTDYENYYNRYGKPQRYLNLFTKDFLDFNSNNPKVKVRQLWNGQQIKEFTFDEYIANRSIVAYPNDGIYQFKLINKDDPDLFIETLPIKVEGGIRTFVSFKKLCNGLQLTAFGPVRGAGSWYRNDVLVPNTESGIIFITTPGRYRTATSAVIDITADAFLQAPKIVTASPDKCLTKATIKIDDDNLLQFSDFQWAKDGKKLDGETLPFLKITEGGTYSLTLKTEDGSTCSFTPFYRFEKQADFKPNLTVSNVNSTNCVVESFRIFTEDNKSYQYEWRKEGSLIENVKVNELIINDLAQYTVTVIRPDGCRVTLDPVKLKTCADPSTNKAILINKPTIEADKTYLFSNEKSILKTVGCTDVNFQWLLDNQPIKDAKSARFEANQNGNYSLQIEKAGCTAISNSVKLTVEALLSVDDEIDVLVNVYPNPTDEKIRVEFKSQNSSKRSIYLNEITGKLLRMWQLSNENQQDIDLKYLPSGTYLLQIKEGEKNISKKIIKN